MKSLVDLLEHLLHDCGRRSGAPTVRDAKTLRDRVEHEGDSFITITLPRYCRDFERCLDEGRIVPGLFASFGKRKSGIPEFLQGFLHDVFDLEGNLLPEPSVDCIRSVRQICLFGKKIVRRCSDERLEQAIEEFKRCDDEVADEQDTALWRFFGYVADIICDDLELAPLDSFRDEMVPKHGPGATQEHILGNQKWRFRRWHTRLEEAGFTYLKDGRASSVVSDDELTEWPSFVEPVDEAPVRVVFVPKTLSTPRVIAVEPVCMQYAQQALSGVLVDRLERRPLTSGRVNFTRQEVNQARSLVASGDGKSATLDMKEASDRVGLSHVTRLFRKAPDFLKLVLAARSTRAQLPNGDKLTLKKFASMGSALCFPVESLVFYTSIIASRCYRAGTFPTRQTVRSLGRDVYVYGDDLIVPADEAPATCDDLEALGFKVNRLKSFWTGKFRESCGWDCYDSELVTPCYLRRDLPTSRSDVAGLLSTIATSNQLHSAGYREAAMALRNAVERIMGRLPMVPVDSPAIGWHYFSEVMPRRRFNRDLQRWEHLHWVTVVPRTEDPLDGDPALAKCFRVCGSRTLKLPLDEVGGLDDEHLATSPTRYGVTLKRRWVPAY